ncbi:MAG: hypothetical protein M1480_20845 [Bacteroidetes bacterium]|nr:hypothetical protein [Bacteroidota bacterium]
MSYRDQQKYLDELRKYEKKFDHNELEEYKMFVKMQKDEEEFDSVSLQRLTELFGKYYQPVDKHKYDSFFKKRDNL